MTNNSSEAQWAVALKKAQQKTTKRRRVTIDQEADHVKEKMQFEKKRLKDAVRSHQQVDIEGALHELIALRARQAALQMEQATDLYGKITSGTFQHIAGRYVADCSRLVSAASISTSTPSHP